MKIHKLIKTITIAILLSGCLQNSPLLNHVNADDIKNTNLVQTKGCALSFEKLNLCASLTWEKQPTNEETGEFTLRFWQKETATEGGPYVDPDATVTAKLWMPSMGHGSSPVKIQNAKDASGSNIPGIYRATEVFFSMGGQWEIWINLKKNGQIIDKAKIDYEL